MKILRRRKAILLWALVFLLGCAQTRKVTLLEPVSPDPTHKVKVEESDAPPPEKPRMEARQLLTFEFDEVALESALCAIAELYEVNVIIPAGLKGTVTNSLHKASLDLALESILSPLGYDYAKKDNGFEVFSIDESFINLYKINYEGALSLGKMLTALVGDKAVVIADSTSNSIAVKAPESTQRQVKAFIEGLDKPRPLVLVEVELIEVALNKDSNFGIEWSAFLTKGNHEVQTQTPFSVDAGFSLVTYGYVNNHKLQGLVEALKKNSNAKLLSNPRIATTSGSSANILIGEKVPYTRRSTSTASGGLQQEVEFEEVGIRLVVAPRVSPGEDMVFIRVHPEVSEVLDKAVEGVPRIGTREATTTVAARNGETVVIGGLIRESTTLTRESIPILGDLIFLRWIFSRTVQERRRTELLVFITPHIMTTGVRAELRKQGESLKGDIRK